MLTKRALGKPAQTQAARQQHCGWRQIVETVGQTLIDVFGLRYPVAKTRWGLLMQVAAKLVAHNLGIWLNRACRRHDLAMATLIA